MASSNVDASGTTDTHGLKELFYMAELTRKAERGRYDAMWDRQLQTTVPGNMWITFQALARDDIMIGLSPEPKRTRTMYEVVIGAFGNTEVVVRKSAGGAEAKRVVCGRICSAEEWRSFWVACKEGTIAVGTGAQVWHSPVLVMKDDQPHSPAPSFASFTSWSSQLRLRNIRLGLDTHEGERVVEPVDPANIIGGGAGEAIIPDDMRKEYEDLCEQIRKRNSRFGTSFEPPDIAKFLSDKERKTMQLRGHAEPGFVTGFDVTSEEEKRKQEQRMKRFGLSAVAGDNNNVSENADDMGQSVSIVEEEKRRKRAEKFGMPPGAPSTGEQSKNDELTWEEVTTGHMKKRADYDMEVERRPEAIHMFLFGVSRGGKYVAFRTNDIMGYFDGFGPSYIEWVNDFSFNIVFEDQFTVKRALQALGKAIPPVVKDKEENNVSESQVEEAANSVQAQESMMEVDKMDTEEGEEGKDGEVQEHFELPFGGTASATQQEPGEDSNGGMSEAPAVTQSESVASNASSAEEGETVDLSKFGWLRGKPLSKADHDRSRGGSQGSQRRLKCQVLLRVATVKDEPTDRVFKDIYRRPLAEAESSRRPHEGGRRRKRSRDGASDDPNSVSAMLHGKDQERQGNLFTAADTALQSSRYGDPRRQDRMSNSQDRKKRRRQRDRKMRESEEDISRLNEKTTLVHFNADGSISSSHRR